MRYWLVAAISVLVGACGGVSTPPDVTPQIVSLSPGEVWETQGELDWDGNTHPWRGSPMVAYAIELEAATTLQVALHSTQFDVFVDVADALGTPLAEDDDGLNGTNAYLEVALPAGTYTVRATRFSSERMSLVPSPMPFTVTVLAGDDPGWVTERQEAAVRQAWELARTGELRGADSLWTIAERQPEQVVLAEVRALTEANCASGSERHCVLAFAEWLVRDDGPTEDELVTMGTGYAPLCDAGDARSCLGAVWVGEMMGAWGERRRRLEQACELGSTYGCYLLGMDLYDDDPVSARAVLQQSCDMGSAMGCMVVAGSLWEDGAPVGAMIRPYRQACELGHPRGCYWSGSIALDDGDTAWGETALERGCVMGDDTSCNRLGSSRLVGSEGRSQDDVEAWLEGLCDGGARPGVCTGLGLVQEAAGEANGEPGAGVDMFSLACAEDDGMACVYMANVLYQAADADLVEIARLYEQACELEAAEGCFHLGAMYVAGMGGLEQNLPFGTDLFRVACEEGYDPACSSVALLDADALQTGELDDGLETMCHRGNVLACERFITAYSNRADREGERLFEISEHACGLGVPAGCNMVAVCYSDGLGVELDRPRATLLFERVCDDGFPMACLNYAAMLLSRAEPDYPTARAPAQVACDAQLAVGCVLLGHSLASDGDVEAYRASLVAYEEGCRLGAPVGCVHAATVLGELNEDLDQVRRLVDTACQAGNGLGCRLYGSVLMNGIGGPADPATALLTNLRGCDLEDAIACNNAGVAYMDGVGVAQSYDLARPLLTKACELGEQTGCTNLHNLP